MEQKKVLGALREAILMLDENLVVDRAEQVVENGLSAQALSVATEAIRVLGDKFQEGEIYLPELILAGETMQTCTAILAPHLQETQKTLVTGKVAMATCQGDIHDIGKNIVSMMLAVSGLEVLDLGVDVPAMDIIERARQYGARIIGLSSLMTTSIPQMMELMELLQAMDLRNKFYVVVGGGPVTKEHALAMKADGWAKDAAGAVKVCERLLESGQLPSIVPFTFEEVPR